MATRPAFNAKIRTLTGRKVNGLRRQGLIPAHVFGKKTKSQSIQINVKDFAVLYAKVGETSLVDLHVESEKTARPVLVVAVQRHPVTGDTLHVDFHQVSLTEKVTAKIPVEITGESPAVRDLGGVLVNALGEIEVEALPTDLPDNFVVDINSLAVFGDSILVKNLQVDASKITVMVDPEETIVTVQAPKAEEVEEAPVAAEAETTVQGKPEETPEAKPEDAPKPEK